MKLKKAASRLSAAAMAFVMAFAALSADSPDVIYTYADSMTELEQRQQELAEERKEIEKQLSEIEGKSWTKRSPQRKRRSRKASGFSS